MDAYYDLGKSPVTHDYCNWLVRTEQDRIKAGEDHIDIKLVRGRRYFSFRDYLYTDERLERRIYELLFPLSRLVPSVRDVCMVDAGEQTNNYLNFEVPQSPVFKSKPIDRAIVGRFLAGFESPVTITVRQSEFEPVRNTNNEEWAKVCEWLLANDCSPIIIPDMEADATGALNGLEDYIQYPGAAYSPSLRLALYEMSMLNMMTTGGPMVLALFAQCPMLAFKLIVEGVNCCTPEHMSRSAMKETDDWGPLKKLYWCDDTAGNIIAKLKTALPNYNEAYKGFEVKDVFRLDPRKLFEKFAG